MAYIKVQKIVRDAENNIVSGSAAIVESIYAPERKNHSAQQVLERLGKVISLAEDKKSGVFLSPTRGLVHYNVTTDTFSPVSEEEKENQCKLVFPEPQIHTVFGDSYLLLQFLEKRGLLEVFKTVFPKKEELERVLAHILHGVLRDGSKIGCDDFLEKSYASYLFEDLPIQSLHSDTAFFSLLGSDKTRVAFFKEFIKLMKKQNPKFGQGCYVDSTPLPNQITNNPFNALCCHGLSSSEIQIRLVLVLDDATGLPVWYDIIPGNVLDLSTVMNIVNDVASTLDIEIESLVLDAGYVCEPLIAAFHIGSSKSVISRMPARRGYPFKELYWQFKDQINKGKYQFVRKDHTYFGRKKKIKLYGKYDEYAYVYVDQNNALYHFIDYLEDHKDEFQKMKDKDKDWMTVKFGYFVLLSNIDTSPEDLLYRYFCRTEIETVFKTSKEYLELLPLSKWSDTTVRGKILHDIIDTIILLLVRKQMENTGVSTSRLFGKTQSLMCCLGPNKKVVIEVPNKHVKQFYKILDIEIPTHLNLDKERSRMRGYTHL